MVVVVSCKGRKELNGVQNWGILMWNLKDGLCHEEEMPISAW